MEITLEVPDRLAEQLQQFQERLPEALEQGLQALVHERSSKFMDEREIITLLATRPTPEQILAIKPLPEFQARVSELLAQSKTGVLTAKGEAELERYLTIEHLVRLAKTHAYEMLQTAP